MLQSLSHQTSVKTLWNWKYCINWLWQSDFCEDPVELEVLHQLALERERKKRGESTTSEVPTRKEPSTPILHSSDIQEGEVDL